MQSTLNPDEFRTLVAEGETPSSSEPKSLTASASNQSVRNYAVPVFPVLADSPRSTMQAYPSASTAPTGFAPDCATAFGAVTPNFDEILLRDRRIVCIANSWDYDPTCKHHVMRALSRHNDVLWINYHGSRRPRPTSADLKSAASAVRRITMGVRQVDKRIWTTTPLVIPAARHRFTRFLHERIVLEQVQRALHELPKAPHAPIQLWTFAPDVPFLLGRLHEEMSVYYCVDDYRNFDDFDSKWIAQCEDRQLQNAGLVIVTSAELRRTKSQVRPDLAWLTHGVDFAHFASALTQHHAIPNDLVTLPKPIFGFFGLLHHWIDVDLLVQVARLRPQYGFAFLGDAHVDISKLTALSNVRCIGRRPYAQLPAYCAHFAAGLLPFTKHPMTRSINPIKLYEYLAAGLPVISTALPEAETFRGPVRFVETAAQFAKQCDETASITKDDRATISQSMRSLDWSRHVARLSRVVLDRFNAFAG